MKDLDFEICGVHQDAGEIGIKVKCIVCGETVILADYAWWDMSCCGYRYDYKIVAFCEKEEA